MLSTIREGIWGYTIILIAIVLDIIVDWLIENDLSHISFIEVFVWLFAIGMLFRFVQRQRELNEQVLQLSKSLSMQQRLSEKEQRYRQATHELGRLIQKQLEDWQLTPSEREIALFLIKGLTIDEIATLRGTKPKTIRQQASSIYRKAGISGRHELAAFFLEDLLNPLPADE